MGKEFTPTWMYVYNYKHEHALTYLGVNGEKKTPEMDLLKRATHANELSMMFPLLEHLLGPLSEEEVTASRKYIKFLFEFAFALYWKRYDSTWNGPSGASRAAH